MDPLLLMLIVVIGMVLLMNFFGKKQRQKIMTQREQAIVVGNEVRTQSGFYGTIVDVDGDTVTLESPAGDETVWHKQAIAMEQAPPYAPIEGEAAAVPADAEPEYGERIADEDPIATEVSDIDEPRDRDADR